MDVTIQGVHVGSNLRVKHVDGSRVKNLRTFTGVRSDVHSSNVSAFLSGFNSLSERQATNATLTTRTSLELAG